MNDDMTVSQSDLEKILDALTEARIFLERRDRMNGQVHLAKEIRYSPLTSVVQAAEDRLGIILGGKLVRES
jgi:hypothetical protein